MSHLKQLHGYTLRTTLPDETATLFLYGRILHLSSSFSDVSYTFRIFDSIQQESRTSFMWNTLIRACAHDVSKKEEAFLLYRKMLERGKSTPDKHTFPFVLKACAYVFGLSEGKQVHCQAVKHGFSGDVYVKNGLIHLYGSCGCLDLAKKIFNDMFERSLVSWNSMIDALVRAGEYDSALENFPFEAGVLPLRYFGLPLFTRRMTIADYLPLMEKIRYKMCNWNGRFLYYAGKLQFINSVIMSLTDFWLSAFRLPKQCIGEIERLCTDFLWSGSVLNTNKAKVEWKEVCRRKNEGDLRIRPLKEVNKVSCLKLVWRVLSERVLYG